MPLGGDCFAVEGTERFQQVVVDYVVFELLLDYVFGAEDVRVSEVEVDLDEGGVNLESQSAAQNHLLHAPIYAEGELM